MMQPREQPIKSSTLDWFMIGLYLILIFTGWLNIYAASYSDEHPSIFDLTQYSGKQLITISISLVVALVILLIDVKFYHAFAYVIYGMVILLLIATLIFAPNIKGAHAWLQFGGFQLQSSEFAKFGASLAIARYISSNNVRFNKLKPHMISWAFALVPLIIILAQNDTGSALVFLSFVLVFYREGLPGIWLVIGLILATIFVLALVVKPVYLVVALAIILLPAAYYFLRNRHQRPLGWISLAALVVLSGIAFSVEYVYNSVLKEHQKSRIAILLDQTKDLKGEGFNLHQSKIAIGSGGLTGKGFLEGTQTKGKFVPEQHSDFIFCTIGEEYGWVGSFIIISLFITLFMRIVHVAERQKTRFNRIYAYSVASILFFHFLINIGMTIGLVPVIGIPLPFISYGGSSLLAYTILLFTLIKLDSNRRNEVSSLTDQ